MGQRWNIPTERQAESVEPGGARGRVGDIESDYCRQVLSPERVTAIGLEA